MFKITNSQNLFLPLKTTARKLRIMRTHIANFIFLKKKKDSSNTNDNLPMCWYFKLLNLILCYMTLQPLRFLMSLKMVEDMNSMEEKHKQKCLKETFY